MNNTVKIIGIVIVAIVVLFGGYKVLHHFTKAPAAMAPVATSPVNPTAAVSPSTAANSVYKMMTSAKAGSYVTDEKGMTLYTYSKDTAGKSNCTGQCIANWPAYGPTSQPASLPADVTVIKRADGTLQYAWKGMPLYYFASDKTAGQVTGNGVGGFTVAK